MPPSNLTNIEELQAYLKQESIHHHKIAVFDTDGILRGKYVDRDKFLSAVEDGFGFCDVVLGWDSSDQLYDNSTISGWHTGYRDAHVTLDLSSLRKVPNEPDTVLLIGQFSGPHAAVCPRSLLQRIVGRAAKHGWIAKAALEYEFFLFDETPHSARAKHFRNLTPFTPGMFGYSVLRNTVHHQLYHDLIRDMEALDCKLEGLHTETGPGVIEAAIRYASCSLAGDKAALFKTFTKIWAQQHGKMATFMAKWSNDYPGQSGHIHLSLTDANSSENLFFDPHGPSGMSRMMRHFVAGQVQLMPELLLMVCPTVNSYRRLVPGLWAPTHANWGIENRTTAIRIIPGGTKATRSEYRVAPADANPYLALAAALGSGIWGIEQQLELPDCTEGNAYAIPPNENPSASLPSCIGDATNRFAHSEAAKELFGEDFVQHFAATREWEDRLHRKHVSDWDLERYFEII